MTATDGEVVHEFLSPPYTTTPPDVVSLALVPGPVRAAMAPSWTNRAQPERTIRLRRLHDVFVCDEGLVLDADQAIHPVTRTEHHEHQASLDRPRLQTALAAGTVIEDEGPLVYVQMIGMRVFGHFLVELLPIAHLVAPLLERHGWRLLVPDPPGPMGAVVRTALQMLRIPPDRIVQGDGSPRRVRELLVLQDLTAHGTYVSPLVMGCMDALMADVTPLQPCPLWVGRPDSPRQVWNEPALAQVLQAAGWRVLDPGRMDLRDQIAAFKAATHVAGVHGSGLCNLVFAPPGTPVTCFSPYTMPDTFMWLLSNLRHHPYREIRAFHGQGLDAPWDAALLLSLPEALAHLSR